MSLDAISEGAMGSEEFLSRTAAQNRLASDREEIGRVGSQGCADWKFRRYVIFVG